MIFFIAVYSVLALEQPHVKEFFEASKSGPIKYSL